mmetsp:Transcript_48313/g.121695  ORF Transcript_48313/g.121695 Transcript_48313/m.121695 type:complete len:517 (+) Transcript_48313:66-1616(+)
MNATRETREPVSDVMVDHVEEAPSEADSGSLANASFQQPMSLVSREEHRRGSEASMQSFISAQLTVILHPILERMESLEKVAVNVSDRLSEAGRDIACNKGLGEENSAALIDARGRMDLMEGRMSVIQHNLDEVAKKTASLRQDIDAGGKDLKIWRDRLEDPETGILANLQGRIQSVNDNLRALQRFIEEDDKSALTSLEQGFERAEAALKELREGQDSTQAEVMRLKSEVSQNSAHLHETRHVADKTRAAAAGLQRGIEEVMGREAQLGVQLNAWKDQWSKLHPELQVVCRDVDHLKRRCDHHDAAIHGAQQASAANAAHAAELSAAHTAFRGDVHTLRGEISETAKGLAQARQGLHEAVKFSNFLHSNVEEHGRVLRKTTENLDALEQRHSSALDDLEKAREEISVTRTETAKSASAVCAVQQDLERTKEDLNSARSDLVSTSCHLDGLRGELGKTRKTVDRLDHGMDFCRAGFSGLQKGLQATGVHLQSRHSVVLPSLNSPHRSATGNSAAEN